MNNINNSNVINNPNIINNSNTIIINREWAMPDSHTFSIKPINSVINKWVSLYLNNSNCTLNNSVINIIDPFSCGQRIFPDSSQMILTTNDINPAVCSDYHLDAIDFLKSFEDSSVDIVLFDPPYSPRQVSECYKNLGLSVNMSTTQASYWSNLKKEISRIVKNNGLVITCAWNSGGIGEKYGFKKQEILLVAHGGWHNDTIVTVECKC